MWRALSALLILSVSSSALLAQPEPPTVDDDLRTALVDSICGALIEGYVFPERAEAMASHLRERLRDGAYNDLDELPALLSTLTADMRSITNDGHLHVDPWLPPPPTETGDEPSPQELERRRWEQQRRRNFAFRKLEILPGNVGYLDLENFVPAELGGDTAVAAMNFLAHCDALIFDLRWNGGGSPSMIQLITSYLVDEPTHLNSFYTPRTDEWVQYWTPAHVVGPKLVEVPVYVLTSERTYSAAEEFSYNLKNLERATLVGETTGGGAHPVKHMVFEELFTSLSLPYARAVNPISETNWEGTGVEPHLEVPAAQALSRAHEHALRALLVDADPEMVAELQWTLEDLEARRVPVQPAVKTLQSYAGDYGDRHVRLRGRMLWYQRGENPGMRMIPMTETLFRFEELDSFRLEVVLEGGRPAKVVGHYRDGRTDESPRD